MIVAKETDPRRFVAIRDKRRTRRRCPFNQCVGQTTHSGFANGVCLMQGCEFHVRQWVKHPDRLRKFH